MTALSFDAHKAVKALKEAGFDDAQAEAVVETVGNTIGGNVAGKADLRETRMALDAGIDAVKAELKNDIAEVRAELGRLETRIEATANRNLLAVIAVGGLVVAALKLFP